MSPVPSCYDTIRKLLIVWGGGPVLRAFGIDEGSTLRTALGAILPDVRRAALIRQSVRDRTTLNSLATARATEQLLRGWEQNSLDIELEFQDGLGDWRFVRLGEKSDQRTSKVPDAEAPNLFVRAVLASLINGVSHARAAAKMEAVKAKVRLGWDGANEGPRVSCFASSSSSR